MIEKIKKEIEKKQIICSKPFQNIEIDKNGNVTSCCPDYGYYILGNIFEQSFEEIWFGEKYNNLRKEIFDGKYIKCNLDLCYNMELPCFLPKKEFDIKNIKYPKSVTLSLDGTCNVQCIFCRDKCTKRTPNAVNNLNKLFDMIDNYFIPMFKNAELILLDGAGEVFVSKFHKLLIQKASTKYPKLMFEILTNGLLCNEKTLKEFGILDRLSLVTVSLHASTEKTYNKIVKNSNFNKVIKNIKYLSNLKKSGQLNTFLLTFVITSLNYQELPEFIEFAYSVGAIPQCWAVRSYNNLSFSVQQEIEKFDVTRKTHSEYEKFLSVLQNPIFKKYSFITDFLTDFNDNITSFYAEKE